MKRRVKSITSSNGEDVKLNLSDSSGYTYRSTQASAHVHTNTHTNGNATPNFSRSVSRTEDRERVIFGDYIARTVIILF
jgi:hypothetical protein